MLDESGAQWSFATDDPASDTDARRNAIAAKSAASAVAELELIGKYVSGRIAWEIRRKSN